MISLLNTTTNYFNYMNCYVCNTLLIWGGDNDIDDADIKDNKIETNLSCPKCEAIVYVHHGK